MGRPIVFALIILLVILILIRGWEAEQEQTLRAKTEVTKEEVNAIFKTAANRLKGIIQYSEEELVSSDIVGNSHSCIIDSKLTQAIGNTVKVLAWYDNEYGYSSRMIDFLKILK